MAKTTSSKKTDTKSKENTILKDESRSRINFENKPRKEGVDFIRPNSHSLVYLK